MAREAVIVDAIRTPLGKGRSRGKCPPAVLGAGTTILEGL